MDLKHTLQTILNFQVIFPSVLTLILILLKAVSLLHLTWIMVFLPLIVSSSVGIVLALFVVTVAYIFGREQA